MELLLGNCLDRLKDLEDNSVDAIVTDPPYGLSFMGKKWDYDVPSVDIWRECLRVLKPGGHLLSFAGSRTYHRIACAIEDAGFEIRDQIMWVYGSGFPKSLNIGKAIDKMLGNERELISVGGKCGVFAHAGDGREQDINNYQAVTTKGNSEWEGWGTALKPAHEPICVARKPISEPSIAANVLKWGTGAINIDGCRVGFDMSNKEDVHAVDQWARQSKSGVKVFNQEGSAKLQEFNQKAPTGRFPANLIHDGSDEVVGLFPQTKTGGSGKLGTFRKAENPIKFTSKRYVTEKEYREPFEGNASRFFYCAKASRKERNMGCEGLPLKSQSEREGRDPCMNSKQTTDGRPQSITPPCANHHPTVKPIALMEYLVKLVSREGHTVLDPFMGSGTTGMACKKLDREFIGIEMMPEYMEIAKARIEGVKKEDQLNML